MASIQSTCLAVNRNSELPPLATEPVAHPPGVAVLNLDNEPSAAALDEIQEHPDVTSIKLIKLPPAGAALPWLGL